MDKKVLVVIVSYNSADKIGDCLSSVVKSSYPVDVLVVDNASSDNTIELVKNFSSIKLISNQKNLGFAGGNNLGFFYAQQNFYDYVYLLNDDTVVEPDFIEQALQVMKTDGKICAVQSKLLLFDDKTKVNSIGNEIHYLGFAFAGGHNTPDKSIEQKEITYPSGAAVLLDLEKLKKIGYFNSEFFMYHEDTDLGWRIWLMGYSCVLAPRSVVYHKYEFSRSIKKYYFMERNRYLVIFQNYRWATIILLLPALMAMDLAMFFYSFIGGFWKEEVKVYAYFLNLSSWKKMFVARKSVQEKRKLPDREVVKRFVGQISFQEINNPLVKYIANPVFNFYWLVVKNLIFW